MTTSDRPITSHDNIATYLTQELGRQLDKPEAVPGGAKAAIAWYMSCGFSRAVSRDSLIAALKGKPELQRLASELTTEEVAQGKPLPEFNEGQNVEVIVNARNLTYHSGVIVSRTWHHKDRKWHYILREDGKRVSKRYEARDLRPNEALYLKTNRPSQ